MKIGNRSLFAACHLALFFVTVPRIFPHFEQLRNKSIIVHNNQVKTYKARAGEATFHGCLSFEIHGGGMFVQE
jgi:hypothetical protein